jgi:serine protease Do
MTMRARHLSSAVLALSLYFGLTHGADPAQRMPDGPVAGPSAFNIRYSPVVDLVKRVKGSVVNIHSERSVRSNRDDLLSPSQNRVNGMGTGIIIDPRGYIITNYHVVEDVNALRIRMVDGTSTPAQVVARDAENDLALIKIEVNHPLPVMPMGTAADLMVGETVVAIGNAFGYDHTVSVGVVSAINRDVTLNKEVSYKSLIQTDAAINPGNSGGPLLNIRGELIGVNVAIRAGAQNIGFAITVDNMMRVAANLISASRRGGPSLGLQTRDQVKPQLTSSPERELVVENLDSAGSAARAGLKRGDVILKAGGHDIACRLDLERYFNDRTGNDAVTLEVRRGGSLHQMQLTLEATASGNPEAREMAWQKLGVRLERANIEQVSKGNKQLNGGLAIEDIRPDSPASKAGLKRGDVLVGLHQWEMLTLDNVAFVLTNPELPSFQPLRFYIIRNGQVHRGWLQGIE